MAGSIELPMKRPSEEDAERATVSPGVKPPKRARKGGTPSTATVRHDPAATTLSSHDLWYLRFSELNSFKCVYLHCNVPRTYSRNPPLAAWVRTMRKQYKRFCKGQKTDLTPHRKQLLDDIEFNWTPRKDGKVANESKESSAVDSLIH